MKRLSFFPVFVFLILSGQTTNAQVFLEGYLDFGEHQVSEGFYSKFSNINSVEKAKWGAQAGYQLGLANTPGMIFNSFYGSLYGKINAGNIPLVIGDEYRWAAFSPDLRETNWVLFVKTTIPHWKFGLGNGIRTYRLSKKAADDLQLSAAETRVTEKWNMMYNVTYLLKPYDNKWNLSGSIANYDQFIIQQENNPMFNLRFDYKINSPLSLYSELWYKSAGLMVIKVTYFGIFLRIGVIWKI
jgi:hypothetical protein